MINKKQKTVISFSLMGTKKTQAFPMICISKSATIWTEMTIRKEKYINKNIIWKYILNNQQLLRKKIELEKTRIQMKILWLLKLQIKMFKKLKHNWKQIKVKTISNKINKKNLIMKQWEIFKQNWMSLKLKISLKNISLSRNCFHKYIKKLKMFPNKAMKMLKNLTKRKIMKTEAKRVPVNLMILLLMKLNNLSRNQCKVH